MPQVLVEAKLLHVRPIHLLRGQARFDEVLGILRDLGLVGEHRLPSSKHSMVLQNLLLRLWKWEQRKRVWHSPCQQHTESGEGDKVSPLGVAHLALAKGALPVQHLVEDDA